MSKRRNHSNSNTKLISCLIIIAILLAKFAINLAFTKTGAETNYSPEEVVEILNNAEEINVYKNYRTLFYKDYNIVVDGEKVAVVSGKFLKLFGDTFTMYSSNGDVMFYEKQEILHLNRQAQFYNADNTTRGRYESKYFAILPKDTYKDDDGEFVARCDKKFAIPSKYVIHGEDKDDVYYNVSKEFAFDNYTILKTNNTNLKADNAVMMICIEDAVSKKSSSSSSNNNSSNK